MLDQSGSAFPSFTISASAALLCHTLKLSDTLHGIATTVMIKSDWRETGAGPSDNLKVSCLPSLGIKLHRTTYRAPVGGSDSELNKV